MTDPLREIVEMQIAAWGGAVSSETLADDIVREVRAWLLEPSPPEIEAIAKKAHAAMNSGVDAAISPLCWESEGEVTRKWWLDHSTAILVASRAVLLGSPQRSEL
jgi:hypothetical protein